jgi:hypothetical protein
MKTPMASKGGKSPKAMVMKKVAAASSKKSMPKMGGKKSSCK